MIEEALALAVDFYTHLLGVKGWQFGSLTSSPAEEPDVLIAIMGATGSGKTTFVNMASGDNLAVGGDLESCTSVVQLSKPFRLDGRRAILVDTPGFDDTRTSDTDVLAMIAAFLSTTYEEGKIQDEMVDQHMELPQTAAGVELHSELQVLMMKHEQEIRTLKVEMNEALRLKETELRDELRTEMNQLQSETNRFRRDAQEMASKYQSEKNRLEAQIQESVEAAKREQARLTNEYERKLSEFERKMRDGAPACEVAELRGKILLLESQIADMQPDNTSCTIF
ncbi:hypothetical protein AB1N83_003897 [Pleurotus pulmonarius]